MARLARLLLAVGLAAAVAGLAFVFVPGLAGPTLEWSAVTVVALLAVLQGARVVRRRLRTLVSEATPPETESPLRVSTPGFDFDDRLTRFPSPQSGSVRDRGLVRDRVRDAVVAVLTRYEDASEAEALAAVADGTWTDDAEAVALLDDAYAQPLTSRRDQFRHAMSAESRFQRRVRRAVQAVARRAGLGDVEVGPANVAADREDRGGEGGDGDETALEGVRTTGRWRGVSAVALFAIGAGVFLRQPAVLLASVVGLGFTAYVRSAREHAVDLDVERRVSDESPDPGDEVTVRVTVRNAGDATLPDLRLVDGVPDALAVVEGSPRLGVGLRPGKAATFRYTVVARQGVHRFDAVTVLSRDVTGAVEQETTAEALTELVCLPSLHTTASLPLRPQAGGYSGRVATRAGGSGVEFHSTREYRRGDPVARVDWKHRARTGELTTVEFREENVATVVAVVDARAAAYLSPGRRTTHTLDRSVDAASRVAASQLASGNRVGIAAASPRRCWLAPGLGTNHRARVRDTLASEDAFSLSPPGDAFSPIRWTRRLRRRLPENAQVVFFSPLCDDTASLVARWLDGYGHPVTVVSPDPTDERTTGQLLSRVERRIRLADLRGHGIRVVDWGWEEQLDVAVERAATRWRT